MNNQQIKDSLESFLNDDKAKICILKGSWGAGKTYFWNQFFEEKINNKTKRLKDEAETSEANNQITISEETFNALSANLSNYSYVSLFGINDLSDLKRKTFNNSKLLNNIPSIWNGSISFLKVLIWIFILLIMSTFFKEPFRSLEFIFLCIFFLLISFHSEIFFTKQFWSNLWHKKTYKNIFHWSFWNPSPQNKLLNDLNKVGIVKKYFGDHSNSIIDKHITDTLICFDDIERLNPELSIDILMGYANELTQQKNCKIIFIINATELEEEQKSIFSKHKEKIVDLEFTYQPTQQDLLNLVFSDQLQKYPVIEQTIGTNPDFSIQNIRTLLRIKNLIDKFTALEIDKISPILTDDFIKNAILLVYCHYQKSIPIEELDYFNILMKQTYEPDNVSEVEKTTYEIFNNLPNIPTIFRTTITNYIVHGKWNDQEIIDKIAKEIMNIEFLEEKENTLRKLTEAWGLYQNTVNPNAPAIISAFKDILDDTEAYKYLPYEKFLLLYQAFFSYQKFDFIGPIQINFSYLDIYININSSLLKGKLTEFSIASLELDDSIKEYLIEKIEQKDLTHYDKTPLNEFMDEFFNVDTVIGDDVNYLKQVSKDEYKDWLTQVTNDENIYSKIRKALKFLPENSNLQRALEEIAEINEFSKYRISHILKEYNLS